MSWGQFDYSQSDAQQQQQQQQQQNSQYFYFLISSTSSHYIGFIRNFHKFQICDIHHFSFCLLYFYIKRKFNFERHFDWNLLTLGYIVRLSFFISSFELEGSERFSELSFFLRREFSAYSTPNYYQQQATTNTSNYFGGQMFIPNANSGRGEGFVFYY